MMKFEDYEINFDYKATLVSIVCESFESHRTLEQSQLSLRELRELCRTLGIEVGSEHIQNRRHLDPSTMLGQGKIEEIATAAKAEGSKTLVFDFELTASQMRNIKKISNLEVLDRCMIILEIFAQHSRTAEAKIQIEIAKLNYMLPRLQSLWTHFSKQRGGTYMKGEGEQQLELDRRLIKERIAFLKTQLEEVSISRAQQKKKRQQQAVTAALVGYTNAGKSSLMNKLCKVNMLSENKLFATLDSTFRMLNPDTKPPMILIDTVGFIQNLPSTLIEGFRTTLESAMEADLLIIVCDLSDPNYQKHIEVTNQVLDELDIKDKEKIIVFNKKDQVKSPFLPAIAQRQFKASFVVSSLDDTDINNLRNYIINYFLEKQNIYELFIPYEDGGAHSRIMSKSNILSTVNHETGIFYKIRVPDFIFNQLGVNNYILSPDDPKAKLY